MRLRRVVPCILGAIATLVWLQPVPAAAAAEGSFQRTLQTTGPVHLEVTTGAGNVQVRTGSSGKVQVTGHIKSTEWFGNAEEKVKRLEANPPIQQSGNDIRIGHIDDPELRRNIAISYDVSVPAETDLRVESGSGNQSVEGIRGPLQIPEPEDYGRVLTTLLESAGKLPPWFVAISKSSRQFACARIRRIDPSGRYCRRF